MAAASVNGSQQILHILPIFAGNASTSSVDATSKRLLFILFMPTDGNDVVVIVRGGSGGTIDGVG